MSSNNGRKSLCPINYVSFSSIYTFNQCKRRFKYQYIDRLPRKVKKHISTIFGEAMHTALACFYTESQFTIEELKWYFFDAFMKCIRREKIDFIKDSLDKHLKRANKMIDDFYIRQKKDGQLKRAEMVEQSFAIFSKKLGVKIGGRIDLGIDFQIIDFKTEKNPNYKQSLKSLQLTVYAWAYKKIKGKVPKGVGFYFLETDKKLLKPCSKDDFRKLYWEIKNLLKFVAEAKDEDYIRNRKNCFFCDYKTECRGKIAFL